MTVSYFEWVQNLQYYRWGLNRVRQELDAALTRAFDAVWPEHNTSQCSLRTAAYMIAIRRVQVGYRTGGASVRPRESGVVPGASLTTSCFVTCGDKNTVMKTATACLQIS